MRITLDADVAPELIRRAWETVQSGLLEDRMLTDLEALGFLVLTHNLRVGELPNGTPEKAE